MGKKVSDFGYGIVNTDDGEVLKIEKVNKFGKRGFIGDNYVRLISGGLLFVNLLKLSGSSLKLFLYLGSVSIYSTGIVGWNNYMVIDACEVLGLTKRTLISCKGELLKGGFLLEKDGVLYINPKYLFSGNSYKKDVLMSKLGL